ncbi:hypothetical protein MACJ_001701 [Theileria orientalis]|uniref:Lipoprotein n=1 Tax=Theileria orientalis TaxID=68886 RepID=A0A976M8U3_THEOR|nr:hypothetical protein MACJ_001701 [Theileria orientalis]
MNLIKIYLLIFSSISSSCSNPNGEKSGLNSESEIVFDLKSLNTSNFTIYEGCNEKSEPGKTYHFVPKPGKTVVKIKHDDRLLWKKIDENSVEDITLAKELFTGHYYSISLVNGKNEKNYLYGKVLYAVFHDTGLVEHLHDISDLSKEAKTLNKFDINSIFDYKFSQKTLKYVPNGRFAINTFKSKPENNFDEISDGPTEIYKEKKLESITITNKNHERYLLKLKTESSTFVYFQYDTKWKRINQEEYNKLNPGEQESVDYGKFGSGKITDTKLDIASTNACYSEEGNSYLTAPTMVYKFENLKELYDGPQLIFNKPITNAKIMVFKGKTESQMIEIVQTVGVTIEDYKNFDENEINGKSSNLGKLNLYFIKKENKWVQCNQLEFLNDLKILVTSNLKEYNEEAQRRLVELGQSGTTKKRFETTEYEKLKNQIDKNEKAMKIISNLTFRDKSRRVEITVDSFYKSEKLDKNSSKAEDSTKTETEEPIPEQKYDLNPGETDKHGKKPGLPNESETFEKSGGFNGKKDDPHNPEDKSNVKGGGNKDGGQVQRPKTEENTSQNKDGKLKSTSDLDKEEDDEDAFYTSSFLLFLPILFLII